MLKTEDIQKLSELTKIKVEDLTNAINAEEETALVFTDDIEVFTKTELETRDINNAKKAGKTAVEIAVKNARNDNEFEFEGKTIENLVKAAIEKGKAEAGVKPNEALKEKDNQIEALKKTIGTIEIERDNAINETSTIKKDYKYTSTMSGVLPADVGWSAKEMTLLFKSDHEIVEVDGVEMVKKDGETLRDSKTQDPLKVADVMKTWVETKVGNKPKLGGRGGNDQTPKPVSDIASIKTDADFDKYCEENKITQNDDKVKLLTEVRKNNPEFVRGQS